MIKEKTKEKEVKILALKVGSCDENGKIHTQQSLKQLASEFSDCCVLENDELYYIHKISDIYIPIGE